jgi:hypothetical protein
MIFKPGDQVRYNPYLLPSRSPPWRNRTGTVISLEGPRSGPGDRLFAQIKMDDDGTFRERISTAMLVPAGIGRNGTRRSAAGSVYET